MGFFEKETSKWVRKKIKGVSKFLGMPCDEFEKEIMALFASIEANHKDVLSKGFPSRSSELTPKASRELKRLDCSINYAFKRSTSKSSGRRRWVSSVPL